MSNLKKFLFFSMAGLLLVLSGGCGAIDSLTSDTDNTPATTEPATPQISYIIIPMELSSWVKINTGDWGTTSDGIQAYGAGYREGHQGILSKAYFDFTNTETYVKWRVYGGSNGEYSGFSVFLISEYDQTTGNYDGKASAGFFTTHHSWNNSVVIGEDTWYYTRIIVNSDSTYTSITATGNYDTTGGTIFHTNTGNYPNAENGQILVVINDNYGGITTNVVVGEAKVNVASAGSITTSQTQALEQQEEGLKTIYVFPQSGVSNVTINGNPVISGMENRLQIDANSPLIAKYSYVNSQGVLTETTQNLDTYYIYHVLKDNGGWSSTIHKSAYDSDKTSP